MLAFARFVFALVISLEKKGNYNYANQRWFGVVDLSYSIHVPDVVKIVCVCVCVCVVVVSQALDSMTKHRQIQ